MEVSRSDHKDDGSVELECAGCKKILRFDGEAKPSEIEKAMLDHRCQGPA